MLCSRPLCLESFSTISQRKRALSHHMTPLDLLYHVGLLLRYFLCTQGRLI
uniref:Uncharacterized protein n=1 Tax=Brassica oleracea var. oleracea TaxID=109376 RepID=A0A0D2ZZ70_BRAOL